MNTESTKSNLKYVAAFILLNLVTSNFLLSLLPKTIFQFAIGMWSPAIFAIIFCLYQGLPVKDTLGLRVGKFRAYLLSFFIPILVGAFTILAGVLFSMLTKTQNSSMGLINMIVNLLIWTVAALGEELGWRGYLHKSLEGNKYSRLLIGVTWSVWHFSQLIPQEGILYACFVFTPIAVLLSYLLSSLRNFGNSIWPCAIFHGVWNLLRTKILFAGETNSTTGLFYSNSYSITNTEGLFGLISLIVVSIPLYFIFQYFKKYKSKENAQTTL